MVHGLSVKILRHRYALVYVNQAHRFRFSAYITDCFHIAAHRIGIGHQVHRGIAAFDRRPASGFHILFLGKARIAEMAVQIHESGHQRQAGSVDHLAGAIQALSHSGDFSIPHQYIGIQFRCFIHQFCIFD